MAEQKKWDAKPTSGGIYIIVVVGLLLLFEMNLDWGKTGNIVFAATVVVGTTVLAWLTKRFIKRHQHDIGEATFSNTAEPVEDKTG